MSERPKLTPAEVDVLKILDFTWSGTTAARVAEVRGTSVRVARRQLSQLEGKGLVFDLWRLRGTNQAIEWALTTPGLLALFNNRETAQ